MLFVNCKCCANCFKYFFYGERFFFLVTCTKSVILRFKENKLKQSKFGLQRLQKNSKNRLSRSWRGVFDTTLCDKVCQWLATGQWFSWVHPDSSTNKAEILLKVALNTKTKRRVCLVTWWIHVLTNTFCNDC